MTSPVNINQKQQQQQEVVRKGELCTAWTKAQKSGRIKAVLIDHLNSALRFKRFKELYDAPLTYDLCPLSPDRSAIVACSG